MYASVLSPGVPDLQLSNPPELDSACPPWNRWDLAISTPRSDSHEANTEASQGVLHMDAIGTVDNAFYVNPYVAARPRTAPFHTPYP
jgi:hypothetical protein